MKDEKIIDLKQQLIGLLEKEEVLAFFDFELSVGSETAIQGLCKMAVPKTGTAKSNYVSLLFIVDAVDHAVEAKVDAYLQAVSWKELESRISGVEMVVPMPHVSYDTRHYLKEVELYLSPKRPITSSWVSDDLYPVIVETLSCSGGKPVFWDDLSQGPKQSKGTDARRERDRSLIETIMAYLRRQ